MAGEPPTPGITWLIPPLCAAGLLWPALWNGYPIVFADTGTYLSQAMHRYLGWDRPAFYSLFIFPLHLGVTTWPVVVAQSGLTVFVLDLTRRAFRLSRWWLLALTVALSVASWLPWMVSELMPDVFTPLLILLLCLLVFSRERFRLWERAAMTMLAAFMIATQQSSVLMSLALLAIAMPLQWIAGRPAPVAVIGENQDFSTLGTSSRVRAAGRGINRAAERGINRAAERGINCAVRSRGSGFAPLLAPGLAIVAMIMVNAVGHGRFSISPYGNVFLLARVIYDGPGMTVLRRDCPAAGWRLCPFIDRFPALSDEFLWDQTSPVLAAGGHKAVSADADAIILAALRAEPLPMLRAAWNNTIEQVLHFASGDGLEVWEREVGTRIARDFPAAEDEAYRAARQQQGALSVTPTLVAAHRLTALAGIAMAAMLLPLAWSRRHVAALFLAVSLLMLPVCAAITGGLSTPHDRYQSRIVWLPACLGFLSLPALRRRP